MNSLPISNFILLVIPQIYLSMHTLELLIVKIFLINTQVTDSYDILLHEHTLECTSFDFLVFC